MERQTLRLHDSSQSLESRMADVKISSGDHVVLVAVDSSGPSEYALNYYLNQLHQPNHFVILHHTFELLQMPCGIGHTSALSAEDWQDMYNKQGEAAKKLQEEVKVMLARANERIRHRFIFEGHLSHKPGEAIVKAAEDYHVNHIVMGTRGRGLLKRTVMGSVSEHVLHHVDCPVTICHLPKELPDKPDEHHHKKMSLKS
ncbi:uncharacterized protein LOC135501753 [Lineus longissimus]|uniref:uncharacterized protein LOC135501753 n=1 Tax=Lineus longissimus TaxID=88925 RepID=UPI002B4F4016